MDSEELRRKIAQRENAKLEFKIEMYKIHEPKPTWQVNIKKWSEDREKHWGELVKDILALANGNVGNAEDTGYLIIGAGDDLKADGTRDLRDVGDVVPTRTEIFQKVKAFCYPNFLDIYCEIVPLDGKRLFVVSIPPSPYLYRVKKQLKTLKKEYSPHTVLLRRRDGEEIYEADDEEKEAVKGKLQILDGDLAKEAHSIHSKISTSVIFFNSTNFVVKVYWLNYKGQRKHYFDLNPEELKLQKTYVTHPWVITNSNEECLCMFQPDNKVKSAIIELKYPVVKNAAPPSS